jgi:hypothetical protein
MADTLLFRGGGTSNIASSTVVDREIVIDTDTDEIVVGSAKKRTIMNGNDIIIDSSGNVKIIGSGNLSAPKIELNANGNITAAGDIQAGGDPAAGANVGSKLRSAGILTSCRSDANYNIFEGYLQGTGLTSSIRAGGSAYFDGTVGVGGASSAPLISLSSSDGSITAAGQVLVKKEDSAFEAQRANGTRYFEVQHSDYKLTLGTADQITLKGADGSITAASASFQSSTTNSWFVTGTSLYSNNYVWAAKDSGSSVWHSGLKTNSDLHLGSNLSSPNIQLNGSNGSITAAGDITCTDNSKGLVLKSPDGTSFRLSVANDGTLSASSI